MKNKILKTLISIILFCAAVYLLSKNTDIDSVVNSFKLANFWLVFLSLIAIICGTLVKAYRWKFMLNESSVVSYRSVLSVYSIALFFSNILPFRLGDIFQVLYLSYKENISKSIIFSSIVAYQVIDFIAILIVFVLSSFFFAISKDMVNIAFIILSLLIILVVIYFVAHKKISNYLSQGEGKLFKKLHTLNEALRIFARPKVLAKAITLTFVLWVISFIQATLILWAFGIKVSIPKALLYIVSPTIVAILPSTPGSFGLWELAAVGALMLFGVNKSLALAAAFATHFSGFIVGFIIGGYFIIKDKFVKFLSSGEFLRNK